jgi:hypothetical protein|tara:strand:+ start:305 stop:601 length:297 start_codon:yes stop_codon:yes gene_type:complete
MKPKLRLVSNNPDLKTYYVPFTTMQVDYYPVKATSPEQAILKANDGEFERIEKRVSLTETKSNVVYDHLDIDHNEALCRNIDIYDITERSYDDIFKNG